MVRGDAGKIDGLVALIREHGDALEYDLMARAGRTLDDVPALVPWRALASFVTNLDATSATYARMHPGRAGWTREAYILADVYDSLNAGIAAILRRLGVRAKAPKSYPRPRPEHRHGAVSVAEFEAGFARMAARARERARAGGET